jgi:hypothetical protein
MSVDRNTDFWHLTPDGWVCGASGMYLSEAQSKEKTPNNCLLTLKYEEYQTSQYSKPDHYMRVTYIDACRYADVVRAILTYGLYPDHGAGQDEKQAASNNKYMIERYKQDMTLADLISKCSLNVKNKQTN